MLRVGDKVRYKHNPSQEGIISFIEDEIYTVRFDCDVAVVQYRFTLDRLFELMERVEE